MKKILLILALIFIGLTSACSSDTYRSLDGISDYPDDIKKDIEKLSDDFAKNIAVPTKLPKSYKAVDFTYASEPFNDPKGNILSTALKFSDGDAVLMLKTMYGNVTFDNENREKTITLENGTKAKAKNSSLLWKREHNNYHKLSFLAPPEGEAKNKLTIEGLTKIANSMQ